MDETCDYEHAGIEEYIESFDSRQMGYPWLSNVDPRYSTKIQQMAISNIK